MKRRRTKDYVEVLRSLIDASKKLNLVLRPTTAMIDFELATKQAYEQTFPEIVVKGCLFHFGQSLFNNVVWLGFKTEYL